VSDDRIPIKRAKRKLRDAPSAETLTRWSREGRVSMTTGERCYLALEQVGGRLYVTEAAWEKFLDELNGRVT
jgi:hypothetical protein